MNTNELLIHFDLPPSLPIAIGTSPGERSNGNHFPLRENERG